jgi:hypothetical protein
MPGAAGSGSLAVRRLDRSTARDLANASVSWSASDLDAPVLTVGVAEDDAVVLGQFQRASEIEGGAPLRRGSGGGAARVAPGTLWTQLVLPRPDALVPCSADKLLNRYVRPLLRALTRSAGAPVSYFGRDWISMAGRPVGLVSFAHEANTGKSLFEAIVGVAAPFAIADRRSFLGKAPATLDALAGRSLDPSSVADAVVASYAGLAASTRELDPRGPWAALDAYALVRADPPWAATSEEAIGTIGAGPDANGRLRVGGELMASGDAIAALEARIGAMAELTAADVGQAVDETLAAGGAVTFGVRSLASIRDVILAAGR